MDSIINEHGITDTITDIVNRDQEIDTSYVAVTVANAKLDIALLENDKLKQNIVVRDEIIQEKDRVIKELERRIVELEKQSIIDQ